MIESVHSARWINQIGENELLQSVINFYKVNK